MGCMRINFDDDSYLEIKYNNDKINIIMGGYELLNHGTSKVSRTTGCEISSDQFLQITSEINNLLHNK